MGAESTDPAEAAGAGPVLARLDSPALEDSVRFAFITDIHLSVDETGTWKQYHRAKARLETAIDDVNRRDVDAVIFGGDLAGDGRPEEFRLFDELVTRLEPPWVAIPGNHDVPKSFDDHNGPPLDSFRDRYAGGALPFVFSVGDLDVVGLNSSTTPDGELTSTWGGTISSDQIEWLRDRLPDLETPVVAMHHNLAPLDEHVDAYPWDRFSLRDVGPLIDVLRTHDVPLVLSGHQHLPATTNPDGLRELIAPAVCSFPQGYMLLDVTDRGTVARFVPLAGREETLEAYWAARTGKVHGVGIASMAVTRLERFPLIDEWTDRCPPQSE